MRKLNAEEFDRYFDVVSAGTKPKNFNSWDTPEIAKILVERNIDGLSARMFKQAMELSGPHQALMYLFMTAFQMGREFEIKHQEAAELEKITGCP